MPRQNNYVCLCDLLSPDLAWQLSYLVFQMTSVVQTFEQAGNVSRRSLTFCISRQIYVQTHVCETKIKEQCCFFWQCIKSSEDQHFSELRVKRLQQNEIKCCTEKLKRHIFLIQKRLSTQKVLTPWKPLLFLPESIGAKTLLDGFIPPFAVRKKKKEKGDGRKTRS